MLYVSTLKGRETVRRGNSLAVSKFGKMFTGPTYNLFLVLRPFQMFTVPLF